VRSRLVVSSIMGFIVAAVLTSAYLAHFLRTAQLRSTDLLFQSRPQAHAQSTVIVGVDERSYRELVPRYGAMFNWPRTLYATALDILHNAGARVVVLDIFFDLPKPEDVDVATAMRRTGNIITPVEAQGPKALRPAPGVAQEFHVFVRPTAVIREAGHAEGVTNLTTDADTVVRSMPILLRAAGEDLPALALAAITPFVRRTTVIDRPATPSTVYAAGRAIPLTEAGSMLINFLGGPSAPERAGAFAIIPLIDVLKDTFDRQLVRDKIVLLGLTIGGLDEFSTPTTDERRMWGVEVLANAIETLLAQRYHMHVLPPITIVSIVLLALLTGLLVALLRPMAATVTVLGLIGGYLASAVILFERGIIVNLVYPAGAILLSFGASLVYRVVFERNEQARLEKQRTILMQLFSKHVSPEVAEAAWNHREEFLDAGRPRPQKLTATVMFTDLAGFSLVSEKMDPQTLMDWVNGYMETIATLVMDHGGLVDDYFGDGIKADFGVPLARHTDDQIRRDAVNAVKCALAIEQALMRLNALHREKALPALRMRIGICTGSVVAGSLGSAHRLKYTTVGDTVNIASRLESFDKALVLPNSATSPCRILISEATVQWLRDEFETLRIGEIRLKGKDQTVAAYAVLGSRTP
jgi:adenylate cyclase